VKTKNKNKAKKLVNQEIGQAARKPAKINADTSYEVSESRMTAYGGLLALTKFLDLVDFKEAFESNYCSPTRKLALGCYRIARLKLLFISARITQSHRQTVVKYSVHDARAAGLLDFMEYLDKRRREEPKWCREAPITDKKKTA